MLQHNRPVTLSYCAKKTKTTNKHFISLLVQEMHCVIFFFVSSGTSNHTKGVIRFQEGSEHPSSHSFSSHLHLQTKWKSISLKKSSNTSKYFDSRTWGLKSTYWAVACTRDYVAEWDCFLSTTFFKSPRLSPENNRRVMRMHLNLNTVRGTGCGGENINRIYTAFFTESFMS